MVEFVIIVSLRGEVVFIDGRWFDRRIITRHSAPVWSVRQRALSADWRRKATCPPFEFDIEPY
jgi:hypothetical protein